MTRIVTFYSYKGGVGRTMALVNTAHVLARKGYRVLAIDFDLEAPGMTHFFRDAVAKSNVDRDAIDLLLHAKASLGQPARTNIREIVSSFAVSVSLPTGSREFARERVPYRLGRLDFIPARVDDVTRPNPKTRDYLARMNELAISEVFGPTGPGHRFGVHLREYFVQARFPALGDALFTLSGIVQASYDYVLIDSRTGLNEIAGLCVGPVSDALVVCSGLNEQNIDGTHYFMSKAGLLDAEKAKPFVVTVGPVPVWHTKESEKQINTIRRRLGIDSVVEIPYHPSAAIAETLFVIDEPKDPIAKGYETLAPALEKAAAPPDDLARMNRVLEAGTAWESSSSRATSEVESNDLPTPQASANAILGSNLNRFRLNAQPSWLRPYAIGFPLGVCMSALPSKVASLAAGDVDRLVLATHVAVRELQSSEPLARARAVMADAPGDLRQLFSVRVVFLACISGADPAEDGRYATEMRDLRRWLDVGPNRKTPPDLHPLVAADIAMLTLVLRGKAGANADSISTTADTRRLLSSRLRDALLGGAEFRRVARPDVSPAAVAESFSSIVELVYRDDLDDKDRATLGDLASRFIPAGRPNANPRLRWRNARRAAPWPEFEDEIPPVGAWPETTLLMASVRAHREHGASEAVRWLRAARASYGWAWRVMVDWQFLEPILNDRIIRDELRREGEAAEVLFQKFADATYPL